MRLVSHNEIKYHMCMTGSQGRINQKRRTRTAVLKSAAELLQSGAVPTVAEAAEAAGVSRATAYRYFPSQDLLLVEASLDAVTPAIEQLLASPGLPEDPEQRLELLLNVVYDMLFENEQAFRALLRLSLEPSTKGESFRGRRRVGWLEIVLSPVRKRFAPTAFRQLASSLAIFLGVECLVVLSDVCLLSPRAIRQTARTAALAILRTALSNH
jgi:AcrR family transcriptional regulator